MKYRGYAGLKHFNLIQKLKQKLKGQGGQPRTRDLLYCGKGRAANLAQRSHKREEGGENLIDKYLLYSPSIFVFFVPINIEFLAASACEILQCNHIDL